MADGWPAPGFADASREIVRALHGKSPAAEPCPPRRGPVQPRLPAKRAGLPDFGGRIVIDANNPIEAPLFRPVELHGRASSEVFAEFVPGARLVQFPGGPLPALNLVRFD